MLHDHQALNLQLLISGSQLRLIPLVLIVKEDSKELIVRTCLSRVACLHLVTGPLQERCLGYPAMMGQVDSTTGYRACLTPKPCPTIEHPAPHEGLSHLGDGQVCHCMILPQDLTVLQLYRIYLLLSSLILIDHLPHRRQTYLRPDRPGKAQKHFKKWVYQRPSKKAIA